MTALLCPAHAAQCSGGSLKAVGAPELGAARLLKDPMCTQVLWGFKFLPAHVAAWSR